MRLTHPRVPSWPGGHLKTQHHEPPFPAALDGRGTTRLQPPPGFAGGTFRSPQHLPGPDPLTPSKCHPRSGRGHLPPPPSPTGSWRRTGRWWRPCLFTPRTDGFAFPSAWGAAPARRNPPGRGRTEAPRAAAGGRHFPPPPGAAAPPRLRPRRRGAPGGRRLPAEPRPATRPEGRQPQAAPFSCRLACPHGRTATRVVPPQPPRELARAPPRPLLPRFPPVRSRPRSPTPVSSHPTSRAPGPAGRPPACLPDPPARPGGLTGSTGHIPA